MAQGHGAGEVGVRGHAIATIAMTGAGGETINVSVVQSLNRVTGTFQGTYQITGGTGRFAGATGAGAFQAVLIPGGARITLTGTINF